MAVSTNPLFGCLHSLPYRHRTILLLSFAHTTRKLSSPKPEGQGRGQGESGGARAKVTRGRKPRHPAVVAAQRNWLRAAKHSVRVREYIRDESEAYPAHRPPSPVGQSPIMPPVGCLPITANDATTDCVTHCDGGGAVCILQPCTFASLPCPAPAACCGLLL